MIKNKKFSNGVDLSSCEKEPIHIIGSTQSHGLLIAAQPETGSIIQAGANAENIIGISTKKLLESNLLDILPEGLFTRIKNAISQENNLEVEQVLYQELKVLFPDEELL